MTEFHFYFLFLLAWVFVQSLWVQKLSKTVTSLAEQVSELESRG